MAPELFVTPITNLEKCDTWSLAVILINMLNGCKYLFGSGRDYADTSQGPDCTVFFDSQSLTTLLNGMLTPNIEKRLTLEQVLQSKWVREGSVATPEQIHFEMV